MEFEEFNNLVGLPEIRKTEEKYYSGCTCGECESASASV